MHVVLATLVAVILPAWSLLAGNGVFAWTMFSKSETYRMTVSGLGEDGASKTFDPRALAPYVDGSLRYFLPALATWKHEPVGLTFRTGLGNLAALACRLGSLRATEVRLEERANLDATPVISVARAGCR